MDSLFDTVSVVTAYLFTIGSGYLGEYIFRPIFEDMSLSSRCKNFFLYYG
jgi:hypothetical protein